MAATAPMPKLAWRPDAEPVNADGEAVALGAVTLWEYEMVPVLDGAGVELTPATVTVL
jgi:hypothetical protein